VRIRAPSGEAVRRRLAALSTRAGSGLLSLATKLDPVASGGRPPAPFQGSVRAGYPPVVINGIPKCGTYLLYACVRALGFQEIGVHLLNGYYLDSNLAGSVEGGWKDWAPLAGRSVASNPRYVGQDCVTAMRRMQPGQVVPAHLEYSPTLAAQIATLPVRHCLVVRDPRDAAISLYRHMTYHPERSPPLGWYYLFNSLPSDDERLWTSIVGVPQQRYLPSVRDRFAPYLGWMKDPHTLVLRFEDLVGAKGGGSDEAMVHSLQRLAAFLGADSGCDAARRVSGEVFGSKASGTFDRGQIGRWRAEFGPRHRAAMRDVCGDLLVELGYEKDDDWV
jgi:hypothetical protein